VGRRDVESQLVHEPGQPRRLALRQVEHEPGQRRGVDDRMLERALQSASDEPGVERVVAVLYQHRALSETQEAPSCVLELGRSDQHRAVDVVTSAGVWVDGRTAVDKRVEERQRAVEPEALGADLEDEERRVAGRLDVERDELGIIERGWWADLRRVDRDLLPRDGLCGAAGFEVEGLGLHQRASASARRAQAISSPLRARRSNTATA